LGRSRKRISFFEILHHFGEGRGSGYLALRFDTTLEKEEEEDILPLRFI
jgi:hypothetical protein